MRIGALEVDPPVALAPMSGVNDRSFRLLCREAGAGLVYTGLISANALRYKSAKTEDLLRFSTQEHPVCAQVFGAEPEIVANAAAEAERRGADIVDLNMGCAVPKVLRARSGVALMAEPERAEGGARPGRRVGPHRLRAGVCRTVDQRRAPDRLRVYMKAATQQRNAAATKERDKPTASRAVPARTTDWQTYAWS
jgi:hypothetical protein